MTKAPNILPVFKLTILKNYLPLLFCISLLSCKKESIDHTAELLSKSWKMSAWTVLTPLEGTPLDGTSTNWMGANDCYSGRIQIFKPGGIFIHEKASICINDTDYTGLWTLSEKNKAINVK